MKIPFYKMQGTGNDFIVLNNMELKLSGEELSDLAKRVCQHRISVGSDAVMAVDFPENQGDFRMRFYNADGTEAEMCGNGARCIARYAYENGIAKEQMVIETLAGDVAAWRLDERLYKVQLNQPTTVELDGEFSDAPELTVDYVELGNPGIPHLVVHYPNLEETDLASIRNLAKALRFWDKLPKGANVNFYDIKNNEIVVRTFERGVEDFTLACGTGSGSTAYILHQRNLIKDNPVSLHVLGGILKVEVLAEELNLIGDTNIVIEGYICDEDYTL